MQFWGGLFISLVGIALLARWYFLRRLDWRIRLLAVRLSRITGRPLRKASASRLLKELYLCINLAIANRNQTAAYQVIDLLKLALGERLARDNESIRLMSLAVAALRAKQADVAGYILDAYKPLMRGIHGNERVTAIEQQTLIAMVAFKARHSFILAKIADHIFVTMEQADGHSGRPVISAGLRALKIIGLMALRRRDEALFREISSRVSSLKLADEVIAKEVAGVLSEWLYRVVKTDDHILFVSLLSLCSWYVEDKAVAKPALLVFIAEWQALAGTAALNPRSDMAARIIDFLFSLAEKRYDEQLWLPVISAAAQTARLAVSQHGLETGFFAMFPLLDTGRRLLAAELKFRHTTDGLRQKVLFVIIKESVMLAALIARKDMTSSTGEIIARLYDCWTDYPEARGNPKSIKKFCQILLLYWLKTRQRKSRRELPDSFDFAVPALITKAERERLGLI